MIQGGGEVVMRMLENVQTTDDQATAPSDDGAGYRNDDGDSFHEVHVNTMEGFWSLLRSWPRPQRGISQGNLPLYVGFFEFVHNVRRRGEALLGALLELLLT